MKDKEITNVILVENPLLIQEFWRDTSRHFMKDKNEVLVKNLSHKLDIWRHILTQFIINKKQLCTTLKKTFSCIFFNTHPGIFFIIIAINFYGVDLNFFNRSGLNKVFLNILIRCCCLFSVINFFVVTFWGSNFIIWNT